MKTVRVFAACLLVMAFVALCLTGPMAAPAQAAGATLIEFRSQM